jgi:hypothetical protein
MLYNEAAVRVTEAVVLANVALAVPAGRTKLTVKLVAVTAVIDAPLIT